MRLLIINTLLVLITSMNAQDSLMYDSIHPVQILATPYSNSDFKNIEAHQNSLNLLSKLSSFTTLQIQSNSPGGLATGLSNGMGARHLAILWDGWNIQSPINGTFDLNQLPIGLFSNSQYINKSQTSNYGNASLAGAIVLKEGNRNGIHFQHEVNTNEDQIYSLQLNQSYKRLQFGIGIQKNNSDLKYSFKNGMSQEQQNQASYHSTDAISSIKISLGENSIAGLNFWYQKINRILSPSKTSAFNGERQEDNNFRSSFFYNSQISNLNYEFKAAYFDEYLGFFTNSIDSQAKNKAQVLSYKLSTSGKQQTSLKLKWRNDKVDANFGIKDSRQMLSLNGQQTINLNEEIKLNFVLRQDWVDKELSPLSFTIVYKQFLNPSWFFDLDISKNYNLPTFNDLYWPSGGNSDLQAEKSYQVNSTLRNILRLNNISLENSITGQYHQVNNWILWSPTGRIWTPKNQRKVLNSSITFESQLRWKLNSKVSLGSTLRSSLSSTTIKEDDSDKQLIGKQLIYVPRQSHHLSLQLEYKDYTINFDNTITGKRFTSTDNNQKLPAYLLSNLYFSEKLLHDPELSIWIQVNNLFNTNYEVIPFYPTPLRYLSIGIETYF